MLVIDASYFLSIILNEKSIFEKEEAIDILNSNQLIAPTLIKLEVINTLTQKLKKGHLDITYCYQSLSYIQSLEITFFESDSIADSQELLDFSVLNGTTPYDSLYLKLALKFNAKIASLDKQILSAAKNHHIPTIT